MATKNVLLLLIVPEGIEIPYCSLLYKSFFLLLIVPEGIEIENEVKRGGGLQDF